MSLGGRPRHHYAADGYDDNGLDCWGLDRDGYNAAGRDEHGYDRQGHDVDGYNVSGRDDFGYDRHGFDEYGRDAEGYNWRGYNSHHRNREDQLESGYEVGPDENPRQLDRVAPSIAAFLCNHTTRRTYGAATCIVCDWRSDIYIMRCSQCPATLCQYCNGYGLENQRLNLRLRHVWFDGESFGLDALFGDADEEDS